MPPAAVPVVVDPVLTQGDGEPEQVKPKGDPVADGKLSRATVK